MRDHHQLRAARRLDLSAAIEAWKETMAVATKAGLTVRGRGLYWVIEAKARAEELDAMLRQEGVDLRVFPGGRLAAIPSLDSALDSATRLRVALEKVL